VSRINDPSGSAATTANLAAARPTSAFTAWVGESLEYTVVPVADVQKAGGVVERVQIERDSPLLSSGAG
jgi:hypothetical protein